jgi:catalase
MGDHKDNKSDAVPRPDATVQASEYLTTNHGLRIESDQDSLKLGERGPSLLEDFILREKITHFDHERIPERIVHARGVAAHGVFRVYESQAELTKAGFLQDPAKETPVFVRFSTVAGSRGSADTARDVRGFAVKFYTDEGNYDLVGNNIPVFFIQDAIKFPDLIHAVKPEPHNEIPQASSAHDTFYDFISLTPESMHMMMWVLSDRAIPRSLRMMEGFGVHTFKFINAAGKARFVKFHWKPVLGVHSLVWDEAQQIAGKDPDFHRRDLFEAIESGNFPEWEFGVQILEEEDEFKFDFDILDATKLWPENLVPVKKIGKMTLNRNPDNYFAETEQVAFLPTNIVPGIDFSHDPLLQGRLFSYQDTQLSRLGSPNFAQIPINCPFAPVGTNQRDGHMQLTIPKGRVAYFPNSLETGTPVEAPEAKEGFVTHAQRIDGKKIRERSPSFADHFSQAALFFNSLTEPEQTNVIKAARFELSKVEVPAIRERMVGLFNRISRRLAEQVAPFVGVPVPPEENLPEEKMADGLSMLRNAKPDTRTRNVAALVSEGSDMAALASLNKALEQNGAMLVLVAPNLSPIPGGKAETKPDKTLSNSGAVLFDAIAVFPAAPLESDPDAVQFVTDTYKHGKPIGCFGESLLLLERGLPPDEFAKASESGGAPSAGIVVGSKSPNFEEAFLEALGVGRFLGRAPLQLVPAPTKSK